MRRLRPIAVCLPLAVGALIVLSAVVPSVGSPTADAPAAPPGAGVAIGRTTGGATEQQVRAGAGLVPAAGAALTAASAGASVPAGTIARGFPFDLGAPLPLPAAELTGYVWPLERGRITVDFGSFVGGTRVVAGERFHDGVDIASFCGDRVRAAHAGIVLAASRRFDDVIGWVGDLGTYYALLDAKKWWSTLPITVVIADGNGYRSIYAHLSRASVAVGQRVSAGQLIGYEGATGRASGCHLHYGLFSPLETATFAIRADLVKRLATPAREIARIDPAAVLPPRPSGMVLGWGVVGSAWERPSGIPLRRR